MDKIIHGICPTCYLTVNSDQLFISITGSGESIYYHRDCEPNRMTFMRKNSPDWIAQGQECKELRESFSYGISELAEDLGVSESKIRKFESGKPVTHAKLMVRSYFYFFRLFELQIKEATI